MIIRHPISTEKFVKVIESENKLVFSVDPKASKPEIAKELEEMLDAKIVKVNTLITPDGKKRAVVRFAPESPAIDIATKLGLM